MTEEGHYSTWRQGRRATITGQYRSLAEDSDQHRKLDKSRKHERFQSPMLNLIMHGP